ncbi:MAG: DUF1295 domain-containing protein [Acholeplasmataceae bacterium]|nr:DUF1295 domain-containing protein [Acholeplasmataceae bacterium]
MTKRTQTFIILFLIYFLAIIVGGLSFVYYDQINLIFRVLVADLMMTLVIWIFSIILKNASIYDPYWSVIPPVIIFAVIIFLDKSIILSIALLFMGLLIWGVRLTYNWASRWQDFSEIDWRYEKMKQRSPHFYFLTNLFGIQLFPTLIVFAQLIGAIIFIQIGPKTNILIWIGFLMMVSAAVIQFIADEQMKKFKERTLNKNLCIEEGLWKYSRHPNYFGEITLWWGVYMMYFGSVLRIDLIILAPLAMTALFLFISIPWMEKKILETRPEYEAYQMRVSKLIPFIRHKDKSAMTYENS